MKGNCPRCVLLTEIYETSLKLNGLIRQFNPSHDDLRKPEPEVVPDPNQMSLLDQFGD